MKKRIVVLDIDGNLTDTTEVHQRVFKAAMKSLELPCLNSDWSSYPDHTNTGILAKALQDNGKVSTPRARAAFEADLQVRFLRELADESIVETPGATELLIALEASAWAPVFATGGSDS